MIYTRIVWDIIHSVRYGEHISGGGSTPMFKQLVYTKLKHNGLVHKLISQSVLPPLMSRRVEQNIKSVK
jgi:hypothetical protein